jgi:hypothetical protein
MKSLSQEEIEDYKSQLDSRKPEQEKRDKKVQEELQKSNETIRMLERRTRNLSFDLPLGENDKIAIRTHLSTSELDRMKEIMDIRGRLKATEEELFKTKPEDFEEQVEECDHIFDRLWLEIVSMITADKTITVEWLQSNPDLISKEDMLTMYLGYVEGQKRVAEERKSLVEKAVSFRTDNPRTDIRPLAD